MDFYNVVLASDPNWSDGDKIGVSRRFVTSIALLSIFVVCTTLLLAPVLYATFTPTPFEYKNYPFKICAVGSSTDRCLPLGENDSFHAGDVIPFIVERCATDPFVQGVQLPYNVSRNIVSVPLGLRIILPSLSTAVPASGCDTSITFAHQLPDTIAPGRYYLEGVATVYGRFRTINAYFRTEDFVVTK